MAGREGSFLWSENGASGDQLDTQEGYDEMDPLLFLIYVNDMPDLALNSEFMFYADDTVLTIAQHSIHELYGNMQSDVLKIKEWCDVKTN